MRHTEERQGEERSDHTHPGISFGDLAGSAGGPKWHWGRRMDAVHQEETPERRDKALVALFMANLPDPTTHNWLRGLFRRWGSITDVFVPKKKDVKGRVFGFVKMACGAHAEKAFMSFTGSRWRGRNSKSNLLSLEGLRCLQRPSNYGERLKTFQEQFSSIHRYYRQASSKIFARG